MLDERIPDSDMRRLAAVMLTDIVGYTALSQEDEALTLKLLRTHTDIVTPMFEEHEGHVVKSTGDGFLVVFPSAVMAAQCAIAIQREMAGDQHPLRIRIGIHVGDIVYRQGDVFGDGVNIVARIEPLAQPGGICVSRQFYDQVYNKIGASLVSLGKRQLKNLQRPLEVFRVLLPWEEAKQSQEVGVTRVAVLPFLNISPDPQDIYLADGMTEELIYTLSKLRDLHVIAHTSVLQYKSTAKTVADVGSELGVGSVLEGSVQKDGNRLRITVQLIDVASQEHIWSERFDREFQDIFAIQTAISTEVASALQIRLMSGDRRQLEKKPTENLEAYSLYMKGRFFWNKRSDTGLHKAIELFQRAAQVDPGYALAYAGLADCYVIMPGFEGSVTCAEVSYSAEEAALKALELDPSLPEAHTSMGFVLSNFRWEWKKAEMEFEKALELRPGYPAAHHWYACHNMYRKQLIVAEERMKRALELNPLSLILNADLGQVYYYSRQFDLAIGQLEETLEMDPSFFYARAYLAMAYLQEKRYAEVVNAVENLVGDAEGALPFSISLAQAYRGLEQTAPIHDLLRSVTAKAKRIRVSPVQLAFIHFALEDDDVAFDFLRRALEERDLLLLYFLMDPSVDSLRSDPRFIKLATEMNLEQWAVPEHRSV